MGRHKIPASQVLDNPLRRAVLEHLARVGGHASTIETCRALGIVHRGSVTWAADILVRAGMIRRHRIGAGCRRSVILTIAANGRAAIAGGTVNSPQALELSA